MYYGASATLSNVTFSGDVAADAGQPGTGNSAAPYTTGATCPGFDTVDVCGTVTYSFPATNVGSSAPTQTITYNISATGTLGTPVVVTGGIPNLDFTLNSTTCTGMTSPTTCSVTVNFKPSAAGLRLGAVQIVDTDDDILATAFLSGIGQGAEIAFNTVAPITFLAPSSGSTCGALADAVSTDAQGNVYVGLNCAGNNLIKYSPAGQVLSVSSIPLPAFLAIDGAGNLYDFSTAGFYEIPAGTTTANLISTSYGAAQLAIDASGNVYFTSGNSVYIVPASTVSVQLFFTTSSTNLESIALDAGGDIYVGDTVSGTISIIRAGTNVATPYITGLGPETVQQLAVDAAGDLYVDSLSGLTEYPAGSTTNPISLPQAGSSIALAVDPLGDVFVVDYNAGSVTELPRSQPPALTFAATPVDGTSAAQTVPAQNVGNENLTVTSFAVSSNFSGSDANCSSLVPGGVCDLSISFAPTVSGSLTGTAVLTDNAVTGTTQSIALSGTATALAQTITFNPIPNQVQGTKLTLTASASSGLPVTFTSLTTGVCTVSGNTATLTNPGTCTIQASQPGNSVYAAATPVSQSFTVTAAANFTIAANPPSETAFRGVAAGFVLTLQSEASFSGNVKLTCSGGPAKTVCLDLPMTVHLNANGKAYAASGILFPKSTPAGTYTITFTGVSGSLTNSTTAKFTVK